MKKKHILIIDDTLLNLKRTERLLSPIYNVTILLSGQQGINYLKQITPDLILLDLHMPEMGGDTFIKLIKSDSRLAEIPVIFITSNINPNTEIKCFELGAVDFISKPFSEQALLSRIKVHLELNEYKNNLKEKVKEKNRLIDSFRDVIIRSTAELVECRDKQTGGHVKRTATYVKILCDELLRLGVYKDELNNDNILDIVRSAPLHDIGKIGISDSTLLKNGKLNNEELEYMKTHTELGGQAIQKMILETDRESFLYTAKDMALYHHEKWDGSGYPFGLKMDEIPVSARIMAIADVYDALTTERSYKKAFSHEEAVRIILDGENTAFDPVIIYAFKNISHIFKEAVFEYI